MLILSRSSRPAHGSALLSGCGLAILLVLAWAVPASAAGGAAGRIPTVTRGGLTVAVPARGMGVVASELLADGSARELQVETGADGTVAVISAPDEPSVGQGFAAARAAVTPSGSPPACADTAHKVFGSWWHETVHWSFKARSSPFYLSAATAEAQLKKAIANITGEHNDCGRADRVSATSHYDGRTTRSVQIDGDATCTGTDGHNTVAFGALPGGAVGFTCWWYQGNRTVEADMQLNKHDFRFAVSPSNCSNAYILQDVTTHEFGHVYGLGHVSQSGHANQTMSTAVYTCDTSDETLGLGDMLGLETHY